MLQESRPSFTKHLSDCGISYHRSGNGPCLLLIHGVGLRSESWYQYIELLSQHFELIIPDLPGHGDSPALEVEYQSSELGNYTQGLSKFISNITPSPFYLCGHSLGSLIAIEMAATLGPKVLGLTALNAIFQRSDTATRAVQTRAELLHQSDHVIGVEQTIGRWFDIAPQNHQQSFSSLCEYWLTNCDREGYAMAYKAFADQRGPSPATLNSISCPSAYVTGQLDQNSTAQMTHKLGEHTPNAKAKVIGDAGHMLPLTHAKDVCQELVNLKSLTPPPTP